MYLSKYLITKLCNIWQDFGDFVELTYSNACEICACGPGPSLQPKEIVKCKNSKSLLKIISLPDFVRGVEIVNIEFGVIFMRGAIRVRNNFKVLVEKVKNVDFQEKSTTIIDSKGTVSFHIKQVHARLFYLLGSGLIF